MTFSLFFLILLSCQSKRQNTKISGVVFGTTYSVLYDSENDYQDQFDSLFDEINQSMSTYIKDSDISRLNRSESLIVDSHFMKVYRASKRIHKLTDGAFDPTIGVVVNAWDFGPEGSIAELDSLKIDSLMQFVGLDKVRMKNTTLEKPKGTFIDFNAIAKGYAVDVISEFLDSRSVENYLVEIGGELRAKGLNIEKESLWTVGVDQPRFDGQQSIFTAIKLNNKAMATSGTYRKYKIDEAGNRYAHIIDTRTGYPSKTNLLSISVIADECMTADAYATAFKAMGVDKVQSFLGKHPELQVFLIFENEKNELETLSLNGFPEG
ncbi:MAG: FAD:protein FMN transferase [Flavobacteriaceae bacterium]|nr:FAD:protein FMN transferase [Flavobacteriaceae bacterium]